MIQMNDLNTPKLDPESKLALVLSANMAEKGIAQVYASVTYTKQTDTKARIAGEDYLKLPGVSHKVQDGRLIVKRYADNAANRRAKRVGKVYLMINSTTRADGDQVSKPTNLRPEGLLSFVLRGTRPIKA